MTSLHVQHIVILQCIVCFFPLHFTIIGRYVSLRTFMASKNNGVAAQTNHLTHRSHGSSIVCFISAGRTISSLIESLQMPSLEKGHLYLVSEQFLATIRGKATEVCTLAGDRLSSDEARFPTLCSNRHRGRSLDALETISDRPKFIHGRAQTTTHALPVICPMEDLSTFPSQHYSFGKNMLADRYVSARCVRSNKIHCQESKGEIRQGILTAPLQSLPTWSSMFEHPCGRPFSIPPSHLHS